RSKSAEYVYATTKSYREAIDAVMDGSYTEEKISLWLQELDKVYNRGFWEGYFMGRKLGEWTKNPGSLAAEKKIYLAKATKYYPNINVAEFLVETGTIRAGEHLIVIGRNTGSDKIVLDELIVNGIKQTEANKGDKITFPFPKPLKSNDKLYKIVALNG
nr:U32 family peptidase [Saprospiraceae bacterium]